MTVGRSAPVRRSPAPSKDVQPILDEVDLRILRALAADARLPNNALAELAGVAPSTCLGRVRAMCERGVIRGYHADVDPSALGRPIQAMIAVRLQAHARGHIPDFMAKIATLPEVLNVFFLGGANDFLVHIAATGTQNLRDFVVVNLSGNPDVALTETNLIFEHVRAGIAH
ncbi:MAG: Lrp/AsnC family transcriptional regulator [Actinomycetota bacterium]|nr:Lrp/AsnC family transcriptional regulator [Actinomycetota bacterium]